MINPVFTSFKKKFLVEEMAYWPYHCHVKKLLLICGPAGIGKSTFARKYVEEHPLENCLIIAADEVRKEMCGSYKDFPPGKNMMPIYDKMIELAKKAYEESPSLTLIFDTTMLYDERRLYFIDNLPHFDEIDLYLLKMHDYSGCLTRNKQRIEEKQVPDEVIESMAQNYEDPGEEVHDKVTRIITLYRD